MVGALLSQKLIALFNLSAKPTPANPFLSCRKDIILFVSIFLQLLVNTDFSLIQYILPTISFPYTPFKSPHHLCSLPDPPDLHLLFKKEQASKRLQPNKQDKQDPIGQGKNVHIEAGQKRKGVPRADQRVRNRPAPSVRSFTNLSS